MLAVNTGSCPSCRCCQAGTQLWDSTVEKTFFSHRTQSRLQCKAHCAVLPSRKGDCCSPQRNGALAGSRADIYDRFRALGRLQGRGLRVVWAVRELQSGWEGKPSWVVYSEVNGRRWDSRAGEDSVSFGCGLALTFLGLCFLVCEMSIIIVHVS